MTTDEWMQVHGNLDIRDYLWQSCRTLCCKHCTELYVIAWMHIAEMRAGMKDDYYMQQGLGRAVSFYQRYYRKITGIRWGQCWEYSRMKRRVKYFLKNRRK